MGRNPGVCADVLWSWNDVRHTTRGGRREGSVVAHREGHLMADMGRKIKPELYKTPKSKDVSEGATNATRDAQRHVLN
jgi:hypothetical protein